MMALMDQDTETGPINIGNPVENTMIELANEVLKQTGSKSKLSHVELPEDDPKQRCPDITKAKTKLQWEPQVPLAEGLEKTITYYRELLAQENS